MNYKHTLAYKEYMRNYMREYSQRPEVKVKEKSRRANYRSQSDVKIARKVYLKMYRQTDKFKTRTRFYYHNSGQKEKQRNYRSRPEVRSRYNSISSVAQGKRRLRVPMWQTADEKKQIQLFYQFCPIGMAVDHIVPLCGKMVSGLHVLSNLQYLTPEENSRKRNHYPVSGRPKE